MYVYFGHSHLFYADDAPGGASVGNPFSSILGDLRDTGSALRSMGSGSDGGSGGGDGGGGSR